MASLSAKAYAQLSALIEENGLSSILGGISNLTSGKKGKTTKFRNNNEARVTKKTSAKDKKKQLLEQLKEEHPDWKLGCGKGLSLSVLKDAVKSGVKPTPKKRYNPYFDFLAIVRKELETQLSPRQIIRIGSCRWQVLKQFAAENGHSNKDIVKSEELLTEVSKNFATIEEDLKDMPEKKSKAKKKTEEKTEEKTKEKTTKKTTKKDEVHPAAGIFASDSDIDSDIDSESDSESE